MSDNKFKEKNFSLEEFKPMHVGDLLRSAREKKSVELRLISQKTRINYKILENIEKNNIKDLPNKTYVKGFVQTYAKEIDLDPELTLQCLEYSYSCQDKPEMNMPIPNLEEIVEEEVVQEKSEKQLQTNKKTTIIVAASIVLIVFAGWLASSNQKSTTEEITRDQITEPISQGQVEEPETTAPAEAAVVARTTQVITPTAIPMVMPTAVPTAIPTATPLANANKKVKPTNELFPEIEFKPIPAEGTLFTINDKSPLNKDNNLLPKNIRNSMIPDKQNVFINAVSDDTWISYKKDDSEVRNFILKQGRTLLIKGDEILLFLGNINATTIFYNNQLVTVKSKSGVKSLVFPDENKSNHFVPLFARDRNGNSYSARQYIEERKAYLEKVGQ